MIPQREALVDGDANPLHHESHPRPAYPRPEAVRPWVTGLGEPSLTLLEDGPAVGLLLADSCHEDALPGRLVLDGVTWARGDETASSLQDHPAVLLYRRDEGGWVAEDPATGRLFPGSGRPSFPLVFLPWPEYRALHDSCATGHADMLLASARLRFGLPPERRPRPARGPSRRRPAPS